MVSCIVRFVQKCATKSDTVAKNAKCIFDIFAVVSGLLFVAHNVRRYIDKTIHTIVR
jgi:hypothetical protein